MMVYSSNSPGSGLAAGDQSGIVVEPPKNVPIMVVAAHPDDMESWCAGTLACSIEVGATVRLLLVTSGDKGSSNPGVTSAEVGVRREKEAEEAARRLGISEVNFLRYPDGDVEDTRDLRAKIVEWIRRWRPAVLFTHDPEYPYPPYITHRDHRVAGRVTLDAVYPLARDRLAFPEQVEAGLQPHSVSQVWLFSSDRPNSYVDISAGFDKKIAARLAHESQTVDPGRLAASWGERAVRIGAVAGLPLGEAFTVLHLE